MVKQLMLTILSALLVTGVASVLAQDTGSGDKSKVIRLEINKNVSEPVLVSKVSPGYPAAAKSEKISGPVDLEVTIGTDGSVVSVKAIKSPDPRLAEAAIEAIKQWKYKPSRTKEGKAVQVIATVTVNFKLK